MLLDMLRFYENFINYINIIYVKVKIIKVK